MPATAERLLAMAANTGAGLKGQRDRALLLLGFAGAFRRSELVALDIEDIEETADGMKVTIRHSKTDQEGAGQTIAIPFGKIACPVAHSKNGLPRLAFKPARSPQRQPPRQGRRAADRSERADIVKEHAARLPSRTCGQFAGLRAPVIRRLPPPQSVDTLRGYVRDAELFRDHAGAELL